MGSQIDLDQGGTYRQYVKVWMGPSVGWLNMPIQAILPIIVAGTYPISPWTNYITIDVNGNVTIDLPSAKASPAGPQAVPGSWVMGQVLITDIGGFASANQYLINPFAGELISGLSQIQLSANFGTIVLEPNLTAGGWTLSQ